MNKTRAIVLTELQLDALTELVNLGVSNAATSLSQMVREEVILSVPEVTVVARDEAVAILGKRETKPLVAVRQDFEGDIHGRALLIFPEAKSMELVRAVVGGELSLEDIVQLEQEALAETGNILLNGCLSTIANCLELSLRISLPEVVHGEGSDFFEVPLTPDIGSSVLFIYINFAVRQRSIEGFIAMLLDLPSIEALQKLLTEFIERTT
jgi:chemotaxis protein CheC